MNHMSKIRGCTLCGPLLSGDVISITKIPILFFFFIYFSFLFPNNIIAFFLLLFGINKTQALDLGPIIKKLYLDLYIVNL
jgi:hypothetical protein